MFGTRSTAREKGVASENRDNSESCAGWNETELTTDLYTQAQMGDVSSAQR